MTRMYLPHKPIEKAPDVHPVTITIAKDTAPADAAGDKGPSLNITLKFDSVAARGAKVELTIEGGFIVCRDGVVTVMSLPEKDATMENPKKAGDVQDKAPPSPRP